MIKKIAIIAIILLFIVSIVGCAKEGPATRQDTQTDKGDNQDDKVFCAQDVKQCSDGTYVSRNPNNDCEFDECPEPKLSEEILEMQEKIDSLTSYEYLDDSTKNYYFVKGDKIVVITGDQGYDGDRGFRYNHVFLDTTTETAYGYCIIDKDRSTYGCGANPVNKYIKLDYDEFFPDDPFADIRNFQDAELINTMGCETRTCDIVEYTKDGEKYRMQVRQRYILPFKIVKLDSEGQETQVALYTNAAFDHLKDDDMNPPEGYELIE